MVDDLRLVINYMSDMECMVPLPAFVRKEVISAATLETYDRGDIIVKEGDVGHTFHMILDGSVAVMKGKLDTIVNVMLTGQAFGQNALEEGSAGRRTASCVAQMRCDVMTISKETYVQVLKSPSVKSLRKKMAFLGSLPMFADPELWDEEALTLISSYFRWTEFKSNEILQQASFRLAFNSRLGFKSDMSLPRVCL